MQLTDKTKNQEFFFLSTFDSPATFFETTLTWWSGSFEWFQNLLHLIRVKKQRRVRDIEVTGRVDDRQALRENAPHRLRHRLLAPRLARSGAVRSTHPERVVVVAAAVVVVATAANQAVAS